ncbi:DUF1127 domain-containing protein [Mesorhizobium sp. BE184]|uniref:DUF1127 domain-containing protein n=1 Tax=Mesorhizobium sp. BE184 TaxID=2817714 RepID=UPI00285C2308|nr:DUF1127 domain-containing protein [Mesorhizobium sp. BE184]MDR7031483.1 uncharacterized protein YjiS (DUF1127 family) [Mesorhizobium sp. BE184]
MTQFQRARPEPAALRRFPRFSLRGFFVRLMRAYDRHLQRLDLAELDDHRLQDLGLTQEEVRRECARSFWRL